MLTQLINNSGISICMVGTPECTVFFEQAMQLARRSVGLQYRPTEYNDDFCNFCCNLFSYQYTRHKTEISDAIIRWLYEHSGGVISVVISLVHDAQEIAILNGSELLNLESLNEAYNKRIAMLHKYISPNIKTKAQTSKLNTSGVILPSKQSVRISDENTLQDIVKTAKKCDFNVVSKLRGQIIVEEVRI